MPNRLKLFLIVLLLLASQYVGGVDLPFATEPDQGYYVRRARTAIPAPVASALNKLNAKGIKAEEVSGSAVDGTGEVPDQHKIAIAAAIDAGIPAFVVQAGDRVVKVIKSPTTEEDILNAF